LDIFCPTDPHAGGGVGGGGGGAGPGVFASGSSIFLPPLPFVYGPEFGPPLFPRGEFMLNTCGCLF
jgi:hypothetical protein